MKRILVTLASVLLGCTGLVATVSPAQADHPITFCHAAGQAGTTQFVTLTLPHQAVYGQAGHFNENGTPNAGHEQDYLGPCNDAPPPPPEECPDGQVGTPPDCQPPPPPDDCPDGETDYNGEAPGCGTPPPPPPVEDCPDGETDYNGDEAGCGTPPPPPPPPGGEVKEVGGVVTSTEVEHQFRCGEAIRIERTFKNGKLADVDRTVTPTGENCSPAEERIPAAVWAREHVKETGL